MISLQNISKTFNRTFRALDNINLEVQEGDIVGIIGSSGAGKSTLIRTVNLLEKPDTGRIIVNGKVLTSLSPRKLAEERKKIGMIFQHFNLLSSRTVFENVALPLELDHVPRAEIHEKVTGLLELVGLKDKTGQYPASLSGGQKQRVAIARALANDPHVLLCDEATSALDPATTQAILQLLRDINQRLRITILLITHEMEVIKAICNHVAVIDHGKLVAHGTLSELIQNEIIKQFIKKETMALPQEIYQRLGPHPGEGLFPIVEVELNGTISFERLIDIVHSQFKIPYRLIKADIEFLGQGNFGKLLLELRADKENADKAIRYFNQKNIKNAVRGYA
ncbi:MAG: ATP-binding cassette domain-containing protein [Leadbetterella sp.]|nr:ATP-binding cassette domain-containing protein [Leadbetterella sp.]